MSHLQMGEAQQNIEMGYPINVCFNLQRTNLKIQPQFIEIPPKICQDFDERMLLLSQFEIIEYDRKKIGKRGKRLLRGYENTQAVFQLLFTMFVESKMVCCDRMGLRLSSISTVCRFVKWGISLHELNGSFRFILSDWAIDVDK